MKATFFPKFQVFCVGFGGRKFAGLLQVYYEISSPSFKDEFYARLAMLCIGEEAKTRDGPGT